MDILNCINAQYQLNKNIPEFFASTIEEIFSCQFCFVSPIVKYENDSMLLP